ncbi:isocitrate lyase/phosphoenolpyruvate mutase family protein [Pseudolysinimonas kribbensis]|uniref:2-methylisocitrate lyase n=1 Tax=Pseudolysinimonas kribbensis TaxID=433641 RepID=A0ABQ6K792_9MICO|nr:isocitrate lyase/phosphoenolpyruvate mutase family protein [Pseudolysinimonas kribbensis]GMA95304.1 2-methylisocitrate lyase [Pseudolysinimonas kribbensis]
MSTPSEDRIARLRELHADGTFVIPNAWDVASAKLLEAGGAVALATTSAGFAATLGREDQRVTLDELVAHVETLAGATSLPISVDSEDCYADGPEGIAETVQRLASAGAAGLSIEDWDAATGAVRELDDAIARVSAAVEAAREAGGLVVTARAEGALYGTQELDEVIDRLVAYREVGADVLYAPGLTDAVQIARVVAETGAPVNVLALPGGPTVAELIVLGVRRVSTGAGLAWIAYGAAVAAARDLARGRGIRGGIDRELRTRAFGD